MPIEMYKKRSTRKRPVRRYKKSAPTWGSTAQKALKLAKHVAGLINAEAKDYYLNQTTFATGNNGAVTNLAGGVTQGSADGQRTGDSIKIKDLTIRGDLTRNSTDDIVRMIVLWDKENNSTVSNILQYVTSSQVVNSPKNDDQYFNTKFLLDKRFVIDTNNPKRMFKEVIRINQHVKYDNNTNAIVTGALKVYFYSQQAASTGTNCEFISKITYMDN